MTRVAGKSARRLPSRRGAALAGAALLAIAVAGCGGTQVASVVPNNVPAVQADESVTTTAPTRNLAAGSTGTTGTTGSTFTSTVTTSSSSSTPATTTTSSSSTVAAGGGAAPSTGTTTSGTGTTVGPGGGASAP